jgi:hypothetical protein
MRARCAGRKLIERLRKSKLERDEGGAVFVEFLISFLPVYVFFLCLIQSALLYSARLVTEHAATNAARAAAVVIGDRPSEYGNEPLNSLQERGRRWTSVRRAALLTLSPLIMSGLVQDVNVIFAPADQPDGPAQHGTLQLAPMTDRQVTKIRVRLEVEAVCRIGFASQIVCPSWLSYAGIGSSVPNLLVPTRMVRAEAIYPYQGARYAYP